MFATIVLVIFALICGIVIGRATVKYTYGGNIVMTTREAEEGTTIKTFTLEVETDLDKLDQKKHVIFKVVPYQPSLL